MSILRTRKNHQESQTGTKPPDQHSQTVPETVLIDGRLFYRDLPYLLPVDQTEWGRSTFEHYILYGVMHADLLAQLDQEKTQTILDVGCGNGRWGRDLAREFSQAQVIGVDLMPMGIERTDDPHNYQFQPENVLHGFSFPDNTFDYVHQRSLFFGIPGYRWVDELRELVRVTKPGGMVELCESGLTLVPMGPQTLLWYEWMQRVCSARGLDLSLPSRLHGLAAQAGLHEVHSTTLEVPVTDRRKLLKGAEGRIGRMMVCNMMALYESSRPLLKQAGMDEGLLNALPKLLEQEWANMQTRLRFFVVLGKKSEHPIDEQPTRKTLQLVPSGEPQTHQPVLSLSGSLR
jgi:SAM-dependent methyltransferase